MSVVWTGHERLKPQACPASVRVAVSGGGRALICGIRLWAVGVASGPWAHVSGSAGAGRHHGLIRVFCIDRGHVHPSTEGGCLGGIYVAAARGVSRRAEVQIAKCQVPRRECQEPDTPTAPTRGREGREGGRGHEVGAAIVTAGRRRPRPHSRAATHFFARNKINVKGARARGGQGACQGRHRGPARGEFHEVGLYDPWLLLLCVSGPCIFFPDSTLALPAAAQEDDEFEEFEQQEWTAAAEDVHDPTMWQDGWADDEEDADFTAQLRAELAATAGTAPATTVMEQ